MSTPNPVPTPVVPPLAVGAAPAVAVIAADHLADGIIRVILRANADPASDSHATFYVQDGTQIDPTTKQTIPATTAADVQAWVEQEKARVARHYSTANTVKQSLLAAIAIG